jgi:hypothetical protein
MELIEKFLFVHASQVKKWGNKLGMLSIALCCFLLLMSPVVYIAAKVALTDLKHKFIEIGNKVDITFGESLGNAFADLEGVVIAFSVIILGAGIGLAANGILYLKLYRLLNNTSNKGN